MTASVSHAAVQVEFEVVDEDFVDLEGGVHLGKMILPRRATASWVRNADGTFSLYSVTVRGTVVNKGNVIGKIETSRNAYGKYRGWSEDAPDWLKLVVVNNAPGPLDCQR